jgi:hypothetical protein
MSSLGRAATRPRIDQDLGQAAAVAVARRQLRSDLDFEAELLVGRQRLKRAANGLRDVLDGIIGEFEDELPGLDLGQVKHIIDEPKQMPIKWLASQYRFQRVFRGGRRDRIP